MLDIYPKHDINPSQTSPFSRLSFRSFMRFKRRSGQYRSVTATACRHKVCWRVEATKIKEIVMATIVTGEEYYDLDGQLGEIKRQIRQKDGYPFDPAELKKALQAVIEGRFTAIVSAASNFFTPILDANLPEKYQAIVAKYRQLATEQGVPATHPVCYRVLAGYTLKSHAPFSGPCHKNFKYLQDWNFPDEATQDSYVFWVPGVLKGSTSMDVPHQRQFLTEIRTRLILPAHHLNSFGKVALVAGLVLAHFVTTGERLSLVLRTDTCDSDGDRLRLYWSVGSLYCAYWRDGDNPYSDVGVPALGVELVG